MLGAIAGDIIGSRPRSIPCRDPVASLIGPDHHYTATTILTVATAHALLSKCEPDEIYLKYAVKFPEVRDLATENADALRDVPWVCPVGWAFSGIGSVLLESIVSVRAAGCGKEQASAAQALAAAVFWARSGLSKEEIRSGLAGRFGLDLNGPNGPCEGSPLASALLCFLESNNFEQTLQAAASAGGSHVGCRAAIAGALAEAYDGGLPPRIVGEVSKRLPAGFLEVVHQFYRKHQMRVFTGEPMAV